MKLSESIGLAIAARMSFMGLSVAGYAMKTGVTRQAAAKRIKAAAKSVDALDDVCRVLASSPLEILASAEKRREMEKTSDDGLRNHV